MPVRKRIGGPHKLVAGLTGGIGCGKSTVAAMFAELGATVIDADTIVRELQAPGGEVFNEIVEAFGPDVLGPDGTLDRTGLSKRVFTDELARKRLERIVHPRVVAEMAGRISDAESSVVILEVPLLLESGSGSRDLVGPVIVVACSPETQLERLRAKGVPDAAERIEAQLPLAEKIAQADYVIHNDGTLAELREHVEKVWEAL